MSSSDEEDYDSLISSSNEEDNDELLEEDKTLIMQLMINKHFGDLHSAKLPSSLANTREKCHPIKNEFNLNAKNTEHKECSNETEGSKPDSATNDNCLKLTRETRKIVIQDLFWEFFENKTTKELEECDSHEKMSHLTSEEEKKLFNMIDEFKSTGMAEGPKSEVREKCIDTFEKRNDQAKGLIKGSIENITGANYNDNGVCMDSMPTSSNYKNHSPTIYEGTNRTIQGKNTINIKKPIDLCAKPQRHIPMKEQPFINQYSIQDKQHCHNNFYKPNHFNENRMKYNTNKKDHFSNCNEVKNSTTENAQFISSVVKSCNEPVTTFCTDNNVMPLGEKNMIETIDFENTRSIIPMEDKEGPFYLDEEFVSISTYQEGLMSSRWNPTQVLYEICSQSQWPPPEFIQINYTVTTGFLFAVCVKDHHFIPRERGKTKKLAKHLATTYFLRFLGFKFTFEKPKETLFNFVKPYNKYWNDGVRDRNIHINECVDPHTKQENTREKPDVYHNPSYLKSPYLFSNTSEDNSNSLHTNSPKESQVPKKKQNDVNSCSHLEEKIAKKRRSPSPSTEEQGYHKLLGQLKKLIMKKKSKSASFSRLTQKIMKKYKNSSHQPKSSKNTNACSYESVLKEEYEIYTYMKIKHNRKILKQGKSNHSVSSSFSSKVERKQKKSKKPSKEKKKREETQ